MSDKDDYSGSTRETNANSQPISRRSVLRGLPAAAIGIAGMQPVVAQESGDTVTIVRARRPRPNGEEELLTEEVPRRWYNQLERARRVNERLTSRLIGRDGVRSVGITGHEERIDGLRRPAVRVRFAGTSGPSVPDHVDQVPVLAERNAPEPVFQSHGSCGHNYYNQDYDPVKGGAIIEGRSNAFDDDGDCTNIGTACCRMLEVGTGTYYLMTAHHVIDGCSAGDVSGQSVYQHGDLLGSVAESYKQHDIVLVNLSWWSSRSGFSDEIVETNQEVSGYVSPDGLGLMASNNEEVEKRGVATGAVTATVDEFAQTLNKCNYSYHDQVEYIYTSNSGGDSGGPYFTESGNGYNLLLGIHSARKDFYTISGAAAYALDTEYGIIPT